MKSIGIFVSAIIAFSGICKAQSHVFFPFNSGDTYKYKSNRFTAGIRLLNKVEVTVLGPTSNGFLRQIKIGDDGVAFLDSCVVTSRFVCGVDQIFNHNFVNQQSLSYKLVDTSIFFAYEGISYLKWENRLENSGRGGGTTKLFQDKIGEIFISRGSTGGTALNTESDYWILYEYNGMPTDTTRISDLFRKPIETSISPMSRRRRLLFNSLQNYDLLGRSGANPSSKSFVVQLKRK